MTANRRGILFLCVQNSVRSQMAEGLARSMAPAGMAIWSAGSKPLMVNPRAVQVMTEIGIDISNHTSKSIDEIPKEQIETVVTLCSEEVCPVFPGSVVRIHWPLLDPASIKGSDEKVLQAFRATRDQIQEKLANLFHKQKTSNEKITTTMFL